MQEEFTEEEVELFSKFKIFIHECFANIKDLKTSENKKLFILAETLIAVLASIRDTDVATFVYIIQRLNKGEKNDTTNNS